MGPIGIPEMMAIFVIALLLFGPKKLPELGRMLGKAFSEFRRAKNEIKNTFETHMRELEREARLEEAKQQQAQRIEAPKYEAPQYTPPSYSYSYPYEDNSPYGSTSTPHEEPVVAPPPLPSPANGTIARSNGTAPLGSDVAEPAESHPRS